ncbi:MAG: hypothetical protein ABIM59_05145 [candidate division WOR-3 bacterium]
MIVLAPLALSGQSPWPNMPFSPHETLNVYAKGLAILDARNPRYTLIEVHRINSVTFRGRASICALDIYNPNYCEMSSASDPSDLMKAGEWRGEQYHVWPRSAHHSTGGN